MPINKHSMANGSYYVIKTRRRDVSFWPLHWTSLCTFLSIRRILLLFSFLRLFVCFPKFIYPPILYSLHTWALCEWWFHFRMTQYEEVVSTIVSKIRVTFKIVPLYLLFGNVSVTLISLSIHVGRIFHQHTRRQMKNNISISFEVKKKPTIGKSNQIKQGRSNKKNRCPSCFNRIVSLNFCHLTMLSVFIYVTMKIVCPLLLFAGCFFIALCRMWIGCHS